MSRYEFAALITYLFINVLFVYKYTTRFLNYPLLWCIAYLFAVGGLLILFHLDFDLKLSRRMNNLLFIACVVSIGLILSLIMLRFDPVNIRVGRFPALNAWINRLLGGEYPYISPTLPSGFPVLFLLAMPFYFLGDLGWLQIFAFLAYALILQSRYGAQGTERLRTLILLSVSPVFLYEIAVRSDLFSNMVIAILYIFLSSGRIPHARPHMLVALSLIGGFVLATRGVVLLIFTVFFVFLFKNQLKRGIIFAAGISAGFIIACLPFAIWNIQYFVLHGPFAIQTSYLPLYLLVFFLILSVYLGARARSLADVYKYTTATLFCAVFVAFLISLGTRGWSATVLGDRFDISYFCFTLPFLLLTLHYGRSKARANGRAVKA